MKWCEPNVLRKGCNEQRRLSADLQQDIEEIKGELVCAVQAIVCFCLRAKSSVKASSRKNSVIDKVTARFGHGPQVPCYGTCSN